MTLLLALNLLPSLGATAGASTVKLDEGDAVAGQLILIYRKGVDSAEQREAVTGQRAKLVDRLAVVDEQAKHEMDLVKVKGDLEKAAKKLEREPEVEEAIPNYVYQGTAVPNDPLYAGFLWGLNNTGQTVNGITGLAGADIDAQRAWDIATGSNQVVVAVVDTGIDYNHEDLKQNMWTNLQETDNGKDDDGNGVVDDIRGWNFVGKNNNPMDDHSHGTHVAGTIGAAGNNGIGVTGVAWSVRLMPVKVLNSSGGGTLSNIISGFAYAALSGANVVNASLGGPGGPDIWREVITEAKDSFYIVAAGNDALDLDTAGNEEYPCEFSRAKLDNLVCVGATGPIDEPAIFSNYSPEAVQIAAPGVNILSTLPDNKYGFKSGTSMATPHVSGAAALLYTLTTGLTPGQAKKVLLTLYEALPSLDGKVELSRRLGLPAQFNTPQPKPPKKPEAPAPTVPPNPPPDRPDLPSPATPGAPAPNLDLYTPLRPGGAVVIIIGPYTRIPGLPALDGTIGDVNRTYVEKVIASLKFQKGSRCWYMTSDPSVPWVENSCNDELYFDLGTDSGSGTVDYDLTAQQRGGLCKGSYTLTTRLITKDGEPVQLDRRRLVVSKGKVSGRCKSKKRKKKRR